MAIAALVFWIALSLVTGTAHGFRHVDGGKHIGGGGPVGRHHT